MVQDTYQSEGELNSAEILRIALDALCEVLAQPFARSVRMHYLLAALENLSNGTSLYPSICILVAIIEGLQSSSMVGNGSGDHTRPITSCQAVELLEV